MVMILFDCMQYVIFFEKYVFKVLQVYLKFCILIIHFSLLEVCVFVCVFFIRNQGTKESLTVEGTRYLGGLVMRYRAFNLLVTSSNLPQVMSDRKSLPTEGSSISYVKRICDLGAWERKIKVIALLLRQATMVTALLL